MKQCESCGTSLGEKTTSKYDDRYCIHCQDQQSGELASKEQVREGSIKAAMKFMSKTRAEAEKMADEMMPKLPRWREFFLGEKSVWRKWKIIYRARYSKMPNRKFPGNTWRYAAHLREIAFIGIWKGRGWGV